LENLLDNLIFKIQRLLANMSKAKFFVLATAKEIISPMPQLRILFSEKCGGENLIRNGFKMLHHHVDFDVILPGKIKDYDLVIPLNMEDLRALHKVPQLINNQLIPIPDIKAINICDDKYLFYQTLVDKGFKDFLPKIDKDLPFPFLLKKKVAWGGNDCYFITSPKQKKKFIKLIGSPDYFCQEIIEGKSEFDTHILFKNHQIVASMNIENSFAKDVYIKGKDEFICTKIVKCPYLDIFSNILESIGFEGLCCFNYKENQGKPAIFEINPRFDGSLSRYFFTFLRYLS
jgi:predicted ATP-grasp superfamily ATP-dependent carboligase